MPHPLDYTSVENASAAELRAAGLIAADHPCDQCGKPNPGWYLGAVCGRCCRANHRKAVG